MRSTLVLGAVLFAFVSHTASAATFTVTNPGSYNTTGTLEWAIQQSNDTPGVDTIAFAVGTGPVTVYREADYFLTDTVIVDGTTQPGFSGTPIVTVKFGGYQVQSMFTLSGAPNSTIRGLIIPEAGTLSAIRLWSLDCTVKNCIIGTDATHTLVPAYKSMRGIDIGYSGVTISGAIVESCIIGNQKTGIRVIESDDVQILSCAIGTNFDGSQPLPMIDSGITVWDSTKVYIGPPTGGEGNIIANCTQDGVATLASNDTVILRNRIYNIGETAIDQKMDDQTDINYNLDTDIFAAGTQNHPDPGDLTFRRQNGNVYVEGTINSNASTALVIEVSASSHKGLSSSGESEYPIGLITVVTDALGDAAFSEVFVDPLPDDFGYFFTTTATREDQSWGTSDATSGRIPYFSDVVSNPNPGAAGSGWIPSGVDSGPESATDPTTPDDVDVESDDGELRVIVRNSTARSRIAGWHNPELLTLKDDAAAIIRGKFYIYASNPMSDPVNTVPNFRLRLENEGAVLASTTYQYATTGYSAPPHEPFYDTLNSPAVENQVGAALRPNNTPLDPSLYRIDFLPVVTPSLVGTRVGATFESYAVSDTANGTLALSEIQLATYTGLAVNRVLYVYSNDDQFATAASAGPSTTPYNAIFGQFNVEADYQPGRLQEFHLPGESPLSEMTLAFETADNTGTILDTENVPPDQFGIGLFTAKAANNVDIARVNPGATYLSIFYASSDMPAEPGFPGEPVQGAMLFEIQTGGGAVTSRLELLGPSSILGAPGAPARELANQARPGANSMNFLGQMYPFPTGERGGVYMVLMPTPLDPDIRHAAVGGMSPFIDEPGEGVDAPSYRDITIGMSVVAQPSTLKVSPTVTIPWTQPHRSRVRLAGAVLYELTPIDDGGYLFTLPPL